MCGEQDSFTEDYEVYKSEETVQPPHRAAAAAAGISQVFADLHGWGGELSRRRQAAGFIVAICCCIQPGSGQSKHEAPLGE